MAHISRFLYACISVLSIAWSATTTAVTTYLVNPIIDWFEFKPDGLTALALDRMAHFALTLRLPTIASQFKAFMERALRHDRFDGERFDPGRQPA